MKRQQMSQPPYQQNIQRKVGAITRKCKYCKSNIPFKSKICPVCRRKVTGISTPIALLFIFTITAVSILASISGNYNKTKNQASANFSNSQLSLLADTIGLNEDQETSMKEIFASCGILEIKTVQKFQAGEKRTSYYIDDEETQSYSGANNTIIVWIDNETKTVQEIYFHDYDIYIDGQVIAKVSDYYVSGELRKEYRVTAPLLINQYLNYPDTAKYKSASGWNFGVQDGLDIVQSTVEAKNAFGQKSTESFQIKYNRETGYPTSIILGGQEYLS